MIDVIIVGGFSSYVQAHSMAEDSPFLLYKNNIFCDVPGLYRNFVEPDLNYLESDIDAPPFVCYTIKQLLHQHGFSAEMIFYLDFEKERMRKILKEKASVVFISTTFLASRHQLEQAVTIVRQWAPDSIIVCGGPFVDRSWFVRNKLINEKDTLYQPCTADHLFLSDQQEDSCGADLFILGDPSLKVAMEVIRQIKKGRNIRDFLAELPNCALQHKGEWTFSSKINIEPPIMPVIDWSLFREDEMRLTVPMLRSKGCPFRCKFCNFQKLSKYKEKTTKEIEKEIKTVLEKHYGTTKYLYFCDDNFCGNAKSMHEFTDVLCKMHSPFKWITMFDARLIDDILAEKLHQAGCILLKIGMESADDRILKNMGKPCRAEHYRRAVKAMAKAGISLDGYFFVGFPGETTETVLSSIETLNSFDVPKYSLNQFIFFAFMLAPLAPIFDLENRKRYKISGYMRNWNHETMDYPTALAWIPEIIKKTTTMQPLHGNFEKMLVQNKKVLAEIDQARGHLIRQRLITGTESSSQWTKLRQLTTQLRVVKSSRGIPIGFE